MTTMQAVAIHDFGGPERLQLETMDRPEPGPHQVLIRVCAASVNPVDYKTRSGKYPAVKREQLPRILGRDISGIVERVGEAVMKLHPGEAVFAMLDRDHGGYAEFVAIDAELCTQKPVTLDHVEAAAVPLAALTAWQGLFDHGGLKAKQRVLIHGGAGGVGHFAVQLAKAKGAEVITTVSGSDIDFARELGADVVIDYRAQAFDEVVHDVDLVYDLVGAETQQRSWSVLKRGGRMVSTLAQPSEEEARRHDAQGIVYMANPDAAELAEIADLIDRGEVRSIVAAKFPLSEVAKAQSALENEHVRGKLVLQIAQA